MLTPSEPQDEGRVLIFAAVSRSWLFNSQELSINEVARLEGICPSHPQPYTRANAELHFVTPLHFL